LIAIKRFKLKGEALKSLEAENKYQLVSFLAAPFICNNT